MATKNAVLDTSAYSHIHRDNQDLIVLLKSYDRLVLTINTLAELKSGYRLGTKEIENLHILDRFLSRSEVGVFMPDEITLKQYVKLDVLSRKRSRILSHNDLWIAAAAQQLGYDLVTFDKDFEVFEELFGKRIHILQTPKQ